MNFVFEYHTSYSYVPILLFLGIGSLELDDAITLRRERGTYLVGLHVSDVSYFVAKDSAADRSACARGMSVHPDPAVAATFPMFPSELSSQLCSLVAGKDRLAITVMFSLDEEGNITRPPDIHRSIVCSGCQLSYEQCAKVAKLIDFLLLTKNVNLEG